jgi:4-methylaminobutanoate oxidase (formaldehyde-forming)
VIPEHLANRELAAPFGVGEVPPSARVVVVGGGIVGASLAYHLTALGRTDVVVLERGRLTNGTTWHAAGLVAQVRGTHALTELSRVNADLYEALPSETGVETGFRRVGSLSVARTEARMQELLYGVSLARDAGLPAEVLEPAEVKRYWPPAATDDVVGATLFPRDGTVNPGDAALALATGAHARGATFVEGARVTGFRFGRGGGLPAVTAVVTDRGEVACDTVVLAGGLWTSELARLAGASVSLYPAEHVWVMTKETPGAQESLPILRDLDGYLYVRHYRGRYLIGAFEPRGKPRAPDSIDDGGFVEFGSDWDHFAPVLEKARQRLPELETLEFEHYLRAPESFTPDSNFHLGEFPEVRGLFVAAGFNSQGIIYAPGAGKALAEWIVEGHPTMDLAEVDIARAGRWQNGRAWLHERGREMLGRLYTMHWPLLQPETARGVRQTPLAGRLDAAGAVFGEAAGWERPNWFAKDDDPASREYRYSFDRPGWFVAVGVECRAARRDVALFDLSTYSKFLVQGPGALDGLQRLCASDVDVAPGTVVYTVLCNDGGGIEMDPTVTRLAEDRFLVSAPTLAQRRTEGLLRRSLPGSATVTDVTSGMAVLLVAGPRARDVLSAVADADLSNEAFPFLAAREVEVGWAPTWILRVSYVGELGWELWVPSEFAVDVHDKVVAAGAPHGMRHAGFLAFDALRLERGFRSWGHDMGTLDDPYQCGLGFTVAKGGGDFVGREALARRAGVPLDRRLVSLELFDPGASLWHGESILVDGRRVGHVTSGAFGHTLDTSVALGWIHDDEPVTAERLAAAEVTVEVRDRVVPAEASLRSFYDPSGARLRG